MPKDTHNATEDEYPGTLDDLRDRLRDTVSRPSGQGAPPFPFEFVEGITDEDVDTVTECMGWVSQYSRRGCYQGLVEYYRQVNGLIDQDDPATVEIRAELARLGESHLRMAPLFFYCVIAWTAKAYNQQRTVRRKAAEKDYRDTCKWTRLKIDHLQELLDLFSPERFNEEYPHPTQSYEGWMKMMISDRMGILDLGQQIGLLNGVLERALVDLEGIHADQVKAHSQWPVQASRANPDDTFLALEGAIALATEARYAVKYNVIGPMCELFHLWGLDTVTPDSYRKWRNQRVT